MHQKKKKEVDAYSYQINIHKREIPQLQAGDKTTN